MDVILAYIWPIAQILLVVAVAIFVLVLSGIAKEYIRVKTNKDTSFAWNAVMNYVGVAVAAVAQIYQQRPAGMSDTDWDALRFDKANTFVVDFAKTLGFTIDKEFLNTIRGFIEGAVKSMKKPEPTTLGLLDARSSLLGKNATLSEASENSMYIDGPLSTRALEPRTTNKDGLVRRDVEPINYNS